MKVTQAYLEPRINKGKEQHFLSFLNKNNNDNKNNMIINRYIIRKNYIKQFKNKSLKLSLSLTKNLPEFQTEIINFLGLSVKDERNEKYKISNLND